MKTPRKLIALTILIIMINGCNRHERVKSDLISDSGSVTKETDIKENTEKTLDQGFEKADMKTGLPDGWSANFQRSEIAPVFSIDSTVSHSGKYSARITSNGSNGVFGYLSFIYRGVQPGNDIMVLKRNRLPIRDSIFLGKTSYVFRCYFKTRDIDNIHKNVWVRAVWVGKNDEPVCTELLSHYTKEGEWYRMDEELTVPVQAANLEIQLALQWTPEGTVWWDDVSLTETIPVKRKKIRVSSACATPPKSSTPEKNRKFYSDLVLEAGKAGADIICLGEAITIVSSEKKGFEVAESIPGPTSRALGQSAKRAGTYVVAGIMERDGEIIYNTAILIDRNGDVAGKYRKTHLPETEVYGGITPGTEYPVFQTDFGKIGIEICYDNFFPEVARALAVNGAEIIFLPIWGDVREGGNTWDIVARTRAIDNSCYFVASMYDNKRASLIISPFGEIMADGRNGGSIISADIDLGLRTFEPWLSAAANGEFRKLYIKERRPETYGSLMGK